ncbi:Vp39 [Apocheima cinerarium nucleopolyhedrovirus]|uniref:Vp39 n=1 Tax=Apocheima cinerarium nucleopolyhedrovirus TaxID=307461 RepID=UPI0001D9208F|nr:Vp39 [Apocheima cinerarium nucleopolyhedrovirus]ADB84417.1 Vp39 [Apocheima cinerarium nucleopolyhedrovirus]
MEKRYLPIPDADGNTYNRSIAISLVHHDAVGDERILIPTKNNYQTVLKLNNLSYAEQLVWHKIYENEAELERICTLLEANERYQTETYAIAENIITKTDTILAMANPRSYCTRAATEVARIFGTETNSYSVYQQMPPFMQNLINRAVAPEVMQIENVSLMLRNCSTCHIRDVGLLADVPLYNPIIPKYANRVNQNLLRIENVLKFKGNANALQRILNRYPPYPIEVPLFLGEQIVTTVNSVVQKNLKLINLPSATTASITTDIAGESRA